MHNNEKTFKPTISTGETEVSLGSIGTGKIDSVTFSAVLCSICKNTTHDKQSVGPLKIIMSDYDKVIVIPYNSSIFLLGMYEKDEIIKQNRKRFEKEFAKWSKMGINTCKNFHVGKKFIIKIHDIKIYCWIIINHMYHIRLSYGGGKIQCP